MNKSIPIVIGIILTCLACWMLIAPFKMVQQLIERLDHIGYDLQLKTRIFSDTHAASENVAIIDINDASLKQEGRWPWPRSRLAELTDKAKKLGAEVIAFDIFFAEKEKNIVDTLLQTLRQKSALNPALTAVLKNNQTLFDEDSIFAKTLAEIQTVLAFGFLPRAETNNILPPPILTLTTEQQGQLQIFRAAGYIANVPQLQQAAKAAGFINIFPDDDGIIRKAPLIMMYQNGIYPALSLQAVLTLLDEKISLVTPLYNKQRQLEGIQIGSHVINTDGTGQVLIPFIGKSYTFPYYSASDVLHDKLPPDTLLGKIVFVGTSATGLGDLQATAIENPFPGVEIQATLANGLLLDNFSYKPAWTLGANLFLTALFGLIAAFLFPFLGPRMLALLVIVLPPLLLFLNNLFWHETKIILSLLIPIILILVLAVFNLIYGYLFETRRREHLRMMFGQYVPEEHIEEMLRSQGSYALRGEDRDMTVLFADIRGFTTISEDMPAAELVEMLNTFFTPMTEVIFEFRGTIDKYVGDLIMAFWGAPLKDQNHAENAISAALAMRTEIKKLQPTLQTHHWPELKLGIGINSGRMSVGDMGSRFRRNYTVLGDAVNLAARVEGLSKFYGVDIVLAENTQQNQPKFVFRKLDLVRVKGKQAGVGVYELIGARAELTSEMQDELAEYHQALAFYFKQQWEQAENLLTALHQAHPHTKIYKIYLDRINEFKITPPPANWDGIFVHTTK